MFFSKNVFTHITIHSALGVTESSTNRHVKVVGAVVQPVGIAIILLGEKVVKRDDHLDPSAFRSQRCIVH